MTETKIDCKDFRANIKDRTARSYLPKNPFQEISSQDPSYLGEKVDVLLTYISPYSGAGTVRSHGDY